MRRAAGMGPWRPTIRGARRTRTAPGGWRSVTGRSADPAGERLGGLPGGDDHLLAQEVPRRRVLAAHGAADVPGVHALDDARQLPVAEGDVVADPGEVPPRQPGVVV